MVRLPLYGTDPKTDQAYGRIYLLPPEPEGLLRTLDGFSVRGTVENALLRCGFRPVHLRMTRVGKRLYYKY